MTSSPCPACRGFGTVIVTPCKDCDGNLALTPQLQQAIRLLQLSTVDLEREVQTMLDENPFLERADDAAPREEFGLARADAPMSKGDHNSKAAASSDGGNDSEGSDSKTAAPDDWDGDGSSDLAPDDSEWGGEAPPASRATTRSTPPNAPACKKA